MYRAIWETVFKKTKDLLDIGRKIIFFGTPCQIAGFRNFLRKDYKNLICVDLICHGVPSPKVFQQYVKELQKIYPTATSLSFRDKIEGWNPDLPLALYDKCGNILFRENGKNNIFLQGFLKNIFNRKSCGFCKFSSIERCSDITLGDFWGIQSIDIKSYNQKGTSLFIINTDNGQKAIDNIKYDIFISNKFTITTAASYQYNLRSPSINSIFRNDFFCLLNERNIVDLLEEIIFNKYILNHKYILADYIKIFIKKFTKPKTFLNIKNMYIKIILKLKKITSDKVN